MGAVKVMEVAAGKTVKIAGMMWVVLDHIKGKGTLCLMEDILEKRTFHSDGETGSNNWTNSSLRKYLNDEFKFELQVLGCSLSEMEVDITSDDGIKDYGTTKDYIALLTADQYRKYREFIPNIDDWWWLVTPWNCESDSAYDVRCVNANASLSNSNAYYVSVGVRPALIFKESVISDEDNPAQRSETDIKDWNEVKKTALEALEELNKMVDTIEEHIGEYKDVITDLLNSIHDKTKNKK